MLSNGKEPDLKILTAGDIVGRPGRRVVKELLPVVVRERGIDFVVVNAENAAGGSGITLDVSQELLGLGVDVFTSGDHIWKRKGIGEILDREERILRPANYPPQDPGRGAVVIKSKKGVKVGVVNLLGRIFMRGVDCPFRRAREEIDLLKEKTSIVLVDIHAEATSEKLALFWYLNGLVSAVLGTHTHVQTADERVTDKGTAYITDLGMTGPIDSVLGRRVEGVLEAFITQMPMRFEIATGNLQLQGVILEVDEKTGKALSIERIQKRLD